MWISGKPAAVVKANRDSNPKHGDLCCVQVLLGRSYLRVDKSLLRRRVRSSHFGRNKMAI